MSVFEDALKETRASVTPEMEKKYEKLAEHLKLERPGAQQRIGFTVNGEWWRSDEPKHSVRLQEGGAFRRASPACVETVTRWGSAAYAFRK